MLEVTKLEVFKLLVPAGLSFVVGMLITPLITHFMYKYEWWKKKSVAKSIDGRPATLTQKLHNDEVRKTPRMGGLVVWKSVFIVTAMLWTLAHFINNDKLDALNIVSRNQTWMLLVTFAFGTIAGFVDDLIVVGRLQKLSKYVGGGLSVKTRIGLVAVLAATVGWWVYTKQSITSFHIPFGVEWQVALWIFVPIVVFTMVALYAGSNIDGVDGLSGGIFTIIYTTYGTIAFLQERFDLAALCFIIVGALIAFLWFNIPPARFFMSDTGTMPLTIGLAVIAVITDTVFILPLIALPLVVSIGSVILQLASKKLRNGKKVFLASPIHNHLQLIGWPAAKVTMRYWIFGLMSSIAGLVVFISGGFL